MSIDFRAVARVVLVEYRLSMEGIHGPSHWLRVRANGLALAERTPGADPLVVETFALLHDAKRQDDWTDIGHGERAGDFARRLHDDGLLPLASDQLEALAEACAWHEHGRVSTEPTVGCCWDADRLDLSRLQRRPRAPLLSTAAALDAAVQDRAWTDGLACRFDAVGAKQWGIDLR